MLSTPEPNQSSQYQPSKSATTSDVRSIQRIQTPDGITLTVELAGVPARLVAYIIDAWLTIGFMLFALATIALIANAFSSFLNSILGHYKWNWISSETFAITASFMMLAIFFGCFMLQEWLWQGRTLGKALLKIRVVRNNGQPIGFWEAFGRNLLRLIDVFIGAVGIIVMLFSPTEKRLGDYLVGSIVIADQEKIAHRAWQPSAQKPNLETLENSYQSKSLLSNEEQALLTIFLERSSKKELSTNSQAVLDKGLREYFASKLQVPTHEAQAADFLQNLIHITT